MTFQPDHGELVNLLDKAFATHAERPALGTEHGETWRWKTYRDVDALAKRYAAALGAKGVRAGDVVAVISSNRAEWPALLAAVLRLGATIVPMYEVQQEKDWKFILRDSRAKVCVASKPAIRETVEKMRADLPDLEWATMFGEDDLEGASGQAARGPISPDDLAVLIYTSGTTGNPKGVELRHRGLATIACSLHEALGFQPRSRSVSILPWAHVGGFAELLLSMKAGIGIAIAGAPDRILPAIKATRPTHVAGVPRVWSKLYDGIQKKMREAPRPVRALFERAIRAAIARRAGEPLGLADRAALALAERTLFKKVRAGLGGELRYALSGAAALSIDVARFIDALGIELLEIYGLTEISAIATTNRPGEARLGTVGRAIPGVELRIDDGEVLVKTDGAMRGYRGLEEETRAVFTDDGWVRTGDLGSLDADGYLRITGRVREVYKLENGKFVAPAPIEETLATSPFISQAVIHGLNRPFNVALLVVDVGAARAWAKDQGLGELEPQRIAGEKKIRELVASEVARLSAGFKAYERPERFHIVTEEMSLANDMLTPTLKVKRRKVMEKWGKDLDALYA